MEEPVVNDRERRNAEALRRHRVPIGKNWFDQSSFITIFFNASSVAIPEAERFVVATLQEAAPFITDPELKKNIEKIIHEETAHGRVHDAYNDYLQRRGLPAHTYQNEVASLSRFSQKHFSLLTRLAACATIEHFTACMARQILDTGIFEGEQVDERMDRVWTWHSLEELDHRAVAFDVYRAMGGGWFRRVWSTLVGSVFFLYAHTTCLLAFLRAQKPAGRWHLSRKAFSFLFGRGGVYRHFIPDWFAFLMPGFHPNSIPIEDKFKKQLHHYHIENELIAYFAS